MRQSTPAAHSNCFSASVNIMLICKAFLKIIGAAAVEKRGMYVVGQWHVSAGVGTHLFTPTSVLPTWGPSSSALPPVPWILAL